MHACTTETHACRNEFQEKNPTQAFIFHDKSKDHDTYVVVLRRTEPRDVDVWCSDVNVSWFELPSLGRIHGSFHFITLWLSFHQRRVVQFSFSTLLIWPSVVVYHRLVEQFLPLTFSKYMHACTTSGRFDAWPPSFQRISSKQKLLRRRGSRYRRI